MKKSIKTKLIVLIFVLIALPIFLLGLLSYRITAKSIQGIVEQSIRSLTDRTSKSIEEKMDSVDRSIKILSCDENLAQVALGQADDKMKKDCFDYIEDIQKDNKSVIEKIVIVNLDKKAVLTNDNLNPNIDLSNRKYLQKTLSGTSSKSNVILSKFTGNPAIAIAHPLKENDKIVGAVIGFINFKNISKYAQDIHIGKKGYAYMFDNKGVYVYHPNKNMIFKDNIYNHKNKDAENLIKKLETNKYSEGYYNYNGKKFTRFVKVNDWILCVTADYNEYMNPAIKIRQFTIFLSLIFIIVSILVAYMRSSKNLIDPIIDIEKALLRVKDGDLTVKVNVNTGDEIESLANAFNKTIEYERNLIESIRNSSEELSTSGEELAASAEEINSSTEEISQSMDKVSDDSTNQNKYIVETSEVLVQLSSLVQLAQKKASTTKQNSDETMKTANNGRIMVKHTVEAIDSIKNSAGETAKVLQVVEDLSKKVEEIIGTINSISEQTNLLALNAAIEAARAGEHGKGFSVVAEEVKNLSEESNAGAVEIASLIKEMVSKIKKAVESMDNNKKVIANGVEVVNKTDSAFITIINSVESIGNDIDKIVEITKDEVASSDQIIKLIDNVATISENTAASTEEVASAVEEQSCATETLSEASQVSSNMAIKLNELASKFKIE